MAKRKKASLKDKSPETLGLNQKKGKGMDLLFGGGLDKKQAGINQTEDTAENDVALNGLPDTSDSPQAGLVDELGLPVALEAPPDDLILASAPAGSTSDNETGESDLTTSPFAMPVTEGVQTAGPTAESPDLSGIMEDNSSIVEEEKVSSTEERNNLSGANDLSGLVDETDLSGLVTGTVPGPTTADLSGLATDDLSGLIVDTSTPEPSVSSLPAAGISPEVDERVMPGAAPDIPSPVAPESDRGSLAAEATMASIPPPDFTTPAAPPTTAAPINTPAPAGTFATPYPTAPAQPYPTAASAAPRPTPIQITQAPQAVVGALSALGQGVPLTRESFRPQDELPTDDSELVVKEVTLAERDDELARQVMQYIGPERRDKLFSEIETLYALVSDKLSGNKKDVNFALDTLRQAHNLILESPREYDEAFYRVAIVKTILNRKNNLSSWSYSWGLFVLLYGVLWLAACMAGGVYIINNAGNLMNEVLSLPFQSLFSGFAGGIGGSVAVLWVLYYRVSVKQDFDRQYLMFYLVKPILGFVLGLVMYFLLIAASSIGASDDIQLGFDTSTGVALSAFIGFVAGFRQDNVYDWIYVIIKTISPKATEEAQSKTPLVPADIAKEHEEQIEAKQVKVSLS